MTRATVLGLAVLIGTATTLSGVRTAGAQATGAQATGTSTSSSTSGPVSGPAAGPTTGSNATTSSTRAVQRPTPPARPRTGAAALSAPSTPASSTQSQAGTSPADVEKQVRDMLLRQGRLQMNALVPGSGFGLTQDRFEDGLGGALGGAPTLPQVPVPTTPAAADPSKSRAHSRTFNKAPAFKMGERVSEPLPMRKGGRYDW